MSTDDPRYPEIIGGSPTMLALYEVLDRLCELTIPLPILIRGETGTGKELVARALHKSGARSSGPFVTLNCPAIPEHLIESEVFGYMKGAFTGAVRDHAGLIEQANRGTLYLHEVGDMSLGMQKKLLRVLEEGVIRRVGGHQEISVDVQVLSATNLDLPSLVRAGSFRGDLYYRLAVLEVQIPPLHKRLSDVPLLVEHFFDAMGAPREQAEAALATLARRRDWPGNVRQLRNECTRLLFGLPLPTRPQTSAPFAAGESSQGSTAALRREARAPLAKLIGELCQGPGPHVLSKQGLKKRLGGEGLNERSVANCLIPSLTLALNDALRPHELRVTKNEPRSSHIVIAALRRTDSDADQTRDRVSVT